MKKHTDSSLRNGHNALAEISKAIVENHNVVRADDRAIKRPSVRSSFVVGTEAWAAMEWLTRNVGKPRKLFELLFPTGKEPWVCRFSRETIHAALEAIGDISDGSVRKSFVMSSDMLRALNQYSRSLGVSRDQLFNLSVLGAKLVWEENLKSRYEKQQQVLALLDEFVGKARTLESKVGGFLGPGNPVSRALAKEVMVGLEDLQVAVHDALEKGAAFDQLEVMGVQYG